MIRKLSLALLMLLTFLAIKPQEPIPLDDFDLSEYTLHIPDSQVRTRNIKSKIKLLCDKNGFAIQKGNTTKRVTSYDTDELFRDRDLKEIAKYAVFNKFKVSEFDNGDYTVEAHGELKGGGLFGASAGAWLGQFVVHTVGHGILLGVASFSGPAAPAVYLGLAKACEPFIASAGMAASVGLGIAGGVATGPV